MDGTRIRGKREKKQKFIGWSKNYGSLTVIIGQSQDDHVAAAAAAAEEPVHSRHKRVRHRIILLSRWRGEGQRDSFPGRSRRAAQNSLTKNILRLATTKMSRVKFAEWTNSSLSQHTFAVLVASLF